MRRLSQGIPIAEVICQNDMANLARGMSEIGEAGDHLQEAPLTAAGFAGDQERPGRGIAKIEKDRKSIKGNAKKCGGAGNGTATSEHGFEVCAVVG